MRSVAALRAPIYYGWWVLCAGAMTEMLAIGSTSYAAGLFVLPLERELSLSRAAANSAIPILFTGSAIMAPLVGRLLDRVPIQRVLGAGAIILALGFLAIASTTSLTLMALALFFPAAFGFMAIGPLTTSTLASRWFYRRRGRALGIASVATSGGGIVVVPLLSWGIEAFGWRQALMIEAVLIVAVVLSLAILIIRSGPADLGLENHPENQGRPPADMPAPQRENAPSDHTARARLRDFLPTLNFWSIAIALAAINGISQAIVITLVPYGIELGFGVTAAALLISAFAISAAIVKIVSGVLAEFIDRRVIMITSAISMIGCLTILLWSSSYVSVVIACILAGTSLGCILPASAALIASCFGSPSFGTIMGTVYVAIGVSSIVSVWFVGRVYDFTGDYHRAFLAFLVLAVISALAVLFIRLPVDER